MASRGFWRELKRRHVYRVAAAYAIVGWLLIQVVTQVFPIFHLPDWIDQAIVLLILVGFPIALVLAWAFDATPQGIVLTDAQDSTDVQTSSRSHRAGIVVGLIGVLIALLAGAGWWHAERDRLAVSRAPHMASAVSAAAPSMATTAAGVTAVKPQLIPAASPMAAQPIPAKSIAVLPFENLSTDQGNAYFADGMQDMILTKLAGIGDLKVISRTSTEKYASHPGDLKTIARQLGVATILEGSVQKAGDQVLINVQLIDAASDNHLWADAYSRKLDNIFGVEGEVAQKVADALKAKLTPAETARVAEATTHNAAAFDAFLQAEEQAKKANASQSEPAYLAADTDYLQAIALDPGFALAYARLAYNQLNRHWFATPLTAAQLATTKAYADHALALAPNLPDAHLALGYYYYWGFRQYAVANVEFKRALQLAPNNVNALVGLAFVARRSGQVPQALSYLKQAVAISPRDPNILTDYGWTLALIRRYAEADAQVRRSLILAAGDAESFDAMLPIQLFGFGDADATRNAVKVLPGWRIEASNILAGDVMFLVNTRTYADVFARRFDAALHAWDSAPTETQEQRHTGQAARIVIKLLAGRGQQARPDCEQLAPSLQSALAQDPKSLSLLQQSSWVDVCLGRNADAIALAQRAVAALPISKDSWYGAYQLVGLAQIAAWTDAPDLAVKTIRQLLAMPVGDVMSIERLKLDPVWDPLRKDPAFQALLAKYADRLPATALSDARHD